MRILRLSGTTPRPWAVELNHRLTVVDAAAAAEVVAPLRAAWDGLLQARLSAPELAATGLDGLLRIGDRDVPLNAAAPWLATLVPPSPVTSVDQDDGQASGDRSLDDAIGAAQEACEQAEIHRAASRAAWEASRRRRAQHTRLRWSEWATAAGAVRAARRRVVEARAALEAARPTAPRSGGPGPEPPLDSGGEPLVEADHDAPMRLAAERLDAAWAASRSAQAAVAATEATLAARSDEATTREDLARAEAELAEAELGVTQEPPRPASPEERQALAQRRDALTRQLDDLEERTRRVEAALAAPEAGAHRGIDSDSDADPEADAAPGDVDAESDCAQDRSPDEALAPPGPRAETAPTASTSTPVTAPVGPAQPSAEPDPPPSGPSVARLRAARDRVVMARRALGDVDGSTRLDPADADALEAAHAVVLESWAAGERRVGAARARRRLEEAQQAEREVLARLGFATYTQFMVSGRAAGLPSLLDADEARRNLAQAESTLAALEAEATEARLAAEAASNVVDDEAGADAPAEPATEATEGLSDTSPAWAPRARGLDHRVAPRLAHADQGSDGDVDEAEAVDPIDADALLDAAGPASSPRIDPSPAPASTSSWDPGAAKGRLEARLSDLRAHAQAMLGEDAGDQVAARLRPGVDARRPDLRPVLAEAGIVLDELTDADARDRARAWLEDPQGAAGERDRLAAERTEVEQRLTAIEDAVDAHREWEAAVEQREACRAALTRQAGAAVARRAVEERLVRDQADVARADAERQTAEAHFERAVAERDRRRQIASEQRASATESADAEARGDDLEALEQEVRHAQAALDAAASRLIPVGRRPVGVPSSSGADGGEGADDDPGDGPNDDEPEDDLLDEGRDEVDLGQAEARLMLAQAELAGLEEVRSTRSATAPAAATSDVEAVLWRVLARMAAQRRATVEGGPGPAPLLVVEPFAALDEAGALEVCAAVVGPASSVQTVIVTARADVVRWAAEHPGDDVSLVVAAHSPAS